jgi:hypothetical protein
MENLLLLLWVERKEKKMNGESNLISRRSPKKSPFVVLGWGVPLLDFFVMAKRVGEP